MAPMTPEQQCDIRMRCLEQAVVLLGRQHTSDVEQVAIVATKLYAFVIGGSETPKSGKKAGRKDKQSILD